MKSTISCTNCNLYSKEKYLCERVGGSKSSTAPWDINCRAILAFRGIGCGYSAIRDWANVINMLHSLSHDTYKKGHNRIQESSAETFKKIFERTRQAIQAAYGELGICPDEEGILNIGVSYDGPWQKRGFSSHNGMASVIDLVTGLPVDCEVMSNFCFKYKAAEGEIEDEEWQAKHKQNCPKNFDGTAGAMEVEGAKRLWRRSVIKTKLRYTTILSDGDSKAFDAVAGLQVYGPGITIEKEDCINHVSKRMGTALRNLVAESKAKKDSISGKGKLTKEKIKKIQNYYGRAIKDHANDIPLLKRRIMAILLHLSSTDKQPKHAHCPPGKQSWCFWQRALASDVEPGAHKDHDTLSPDIGKRLVPIFQRLSDDALLKRCSRSMTQNANESLHNLIWRLCPKVTFVGRKTFETAVSLAICQFSMGATFKVALCEALNMAPGQILQKSTVAKNADRIDKAERASSKEMKQRRKKVKYQRQSKEQKKKSEEGEAYSAGGFDY